MSTTIPTTLAEYQKYVREEALKVQLDMNWPDHKLNETLRALGLPEKRTFEVPVLVTGEMFVVVTVDDAMSEEEARASIASLEGDALQTKLNRTVNTGYFAVKGSDLVDEAPKIEVGALDTTFTNQSVVNAANRRAAAEGREYARQCEHEHTLSGPRRYFYCTRERGHEGDHAQGDSRVIIQTWPQAAA